MHNTPLNQLEQCSLRWQYADALAPGAHCWPVFASRNGSRLSHRNVERRDFDAAAANAGIEGVTLHDLRHAYGSRLASRGLSAKQIADAMDHKRTSTMEIYIQRFNGEAAD